MSTMQQEKISREQLQETVLGFSEPLLEDAVRRKGGRRRIVELVEEQSNRIITGPGKRYRILLTYVMARALGADYKDEELIRAAVPIELTHGWSLELDDVHDDDDERRDEKTLQRFLEEKTGIDRKDAESLATTEAVFMSATARDAIYGLDFLSYRDRIELARYLSDAEKDLAHGQELDVTSEYLLDDALDAEELLSAEDEEFDFIDFYHDVVLGKTVPLFEASAEFASYLSGFDGDELVEYSRQIGLAFQKRDDVLDFFPSEESGKDQYSDVKEGTMTLPVHYALEELEEVETTGLQDWNMMGSFNHAECSIEQFRDIVESYEDRRDFLEDVLKREDPEDYEVEIAGEVVESTDALERVNQEAVGHAEAAIGYLEDVELEEPYAEVLEEVATYAATRTN